MMKRAFEKHGITVTALLVLSLMIALVATMPDPPGPTVFEMQERQELADAIKKVKERE